MSTPEAAAPALPRHFMRPCVLLLLREEAAHGYDLLQRLRTFGFVRDDPGRLYRMLRTLEDEGLVQSAWERSESGPDRRIYELTRSGVEELHSASHALAAASDVMDVFLTRYSEFVEIRPRREKARASR